MRSGIKRACCAAGLLTAALGLNAIDLGRGFWLGAVVRAGGAFETNKEGDGYTSGKTWEFTDGDPKFELEIKQDGAYGAVFWFNQWTGSGASGRLWLNLGRFNISAGGMDGFKVDRVQELYTGSFNGIEAAYSPVDGLRFSVSLPAFEYYEDNRPASYYALENMVSESTLGVTYWHKWFNVKFGLRFNDTDNAPDAYSLKDTTTMRCVWELGLGNVPRLDLAMNGEAFRMNDPLRASANFHFKALYTITEVFRAGAYVNYSLAGTGKAWSGAGDWDYDARSDVQVLPWLEVRPWRPFVWTFETGPKLSFFEGWAARGLIAGDPHFLEWSVKTTLEYAFNDKVRAFARYEMWHRFPYAETGLSGIDQHKFYLWAVFFYQ
ncbi:MAG: hypothetical protein LBR16_00315 [Treponema sp.]|jgi:hypothetical protein|nr:hypothetical protein [Treponema sp.]